jgi:hypothetical protein
LDTDFRIIPLLLLIGGLAFIIYAWAKGWFKGARRGSFTSQAVMHDWLNEDKQDAIEYVMDGEEEKQKKDARTDEGPETALEDQDESP